MKKKLTAVFLAVILCLVTGCGNSPEQKAEKTYYDNSGEISVDYSYDDMLEFRLGILTTDRVKEVQPVNLIGDGFEEEAFSLSVINATMEQYENHKYRGLYCSYWLFECSNDLEPGEYVINGINLLIDGEARTVSFAEPLRFTKLAEDEYRGFFDSDGLQCGSFANDFGTEFINSGEQAGYSFRALENLTIEAVTMRNSDITVTAEVYLNGNDRPCTFPVAVKEGDTVKLSLSLQSDSISRAYDIMTELQIHMHTEDREIVKSGIVCFESLSPISDDLREVDVFIDTILNEAGEAAEEHAE